jgi:hypothetical protein
MTLDDAYNKYLQPEQLILFLAKNELYYQISLSHYISLTSFDGDDALEKMSELNLQVDTNTAYMVLKEILERFCYQEDFEKQIDEYIKIGACFQSLADFVQSDTELLHNHIFQENITRTIENGTFFSAHLQKQFEEGIDESIQKWDLIIRSIVTEREFIKDDREKRFH